MNCDSGLTWSLSVYVLVLGELHHPVGCTQPNSMHLKPMFPCLVSHRRGLRVGSKTCLHLAGTPCPGYDVTLKAGFVT